MFYKGIIFDLDNTLYSYTNSHAIALQETLIYISTTFQIDIQQLNSKYTKISNSLKYELVNTASCHNKNIYLKQLLENHKIQLDQLETINNIYWTTFLNAATKYEGVKEFIEWNRQIGIKIGILTDYETEYQIKKLHKLGLLEYIDVIVTSEEIGIEKPSSQMFQIILNKMNLKNSEVIMIGDDYKKDIEGANNMNIFNYWYTQTHTTHPSFSCWITLHNKFKSIYEDLTKLKQMSRYVGERFDLVQAGGGNSSVKHDEWMFIKASGINMANITESAGYVVVNNKEIIEDIQKKKVKDVINYNVLSNTRGSIETYMHSILKKYTLHIHPIQVNRILITKNARTYFSNRFPEALIIDYFTPGIKICDEIKSKYNNENIIFMTNHGLIITSDIYEDIYIILNNVLDTVESDLSMNVNRYKYTNQISKFINDTWSQNIITYLCENMQIMEYLLKKPQLFTENHTFPDAFIYCGIKIAFIEKIEDLCHFYTIYKEAPKIIIIHNDIYISSHSLSKCREIEEVLLSNLIIVDSTEEKTFLSPDEIYFLNTWDAEKYRQQI